jgi:hypothetical protein
VRPEPHDMHILPAVGDGCNDCKEIDDYTVVVCQRPAHDLSCTSSYFLFAIMAGYTSGHHSFLMRRHHLWSKMGICDREHPFCTEGEMLEPSQLLHGRALRSQFLRSLGVSLMNCARNNNSSMISLCDNRKKSMRIKRKLSLEINQQRDCGRIIRHINCALRARQLVITQTLISLPRCVSGICQIGPGIAMTYLTFI